MYILFGHSVIPAKICLFLTMIMIRAWFYVAIFSMFRCTNMFPSYARIVRLSHRPSRDVPLGSGNSAVDPKIPRRFAHTLEIQNWLVLGPPL